MSIPGSTNPLLLFGDPTGGQYQIQRSLRFNSSDSAFLSRAVPTAGNRKTFTFACWLKRASLAAASQVIFGTADAVTNNNSFAIRFNSSHQLEIYDLNPGFNLEIYTTQVFRDVSSWGHLVVAIDTTQATASNRVKIYWNGNQITAFSTANYPAQNLDLIVNNVRNHSIGRGGDFDGIYFNGYLADIHFIDGQAIDPSSFTEVSATTGQLIPKAYTGSFGTNGFKLTFSDNSNTTAATLGKDSAGSNNWTPNNFSVTQTVLYSSTITLGSGGGTTTGSDNPKNAFDGNTSTEFGRGILQSATPNGGWSWNAAPYNLTANSSNAIRIYHCVRNGTLFYVNGSQVTPNYNGLVHPQSGWITLPTTSGAAITSISANGTSTSAPQSCGSVYAIEINGTTLVDNSGVGNDSLVDTPTSYGTDTGAGGEVRGNYCTLNPLSPVSGFTLSNGNLDVSFTSYDRVIVGTFGMTSGKWYWEYTQGSSGTNQTYGILSASAELAAFGGNTGGYCMLPVLSRFYANGSFNSYGSPLTSGDVLGVAFNADTGILTFYKNGTTLGTASSSIPAGTYLPSVGNSGTGTNTMTANFGQRAFAYTAPSGFKALCDTNLTSTTITTSGSYTGNGTADGPFVYLNGVPTAMTIGGNAVTFGTHADKLSNGFKIRTSSTTYNQNASSYSYSITSTGAAFKNARAQPNP